MTTPPVPAIPTTPPTPPPVVPATPLGWLRSLPPPVPDGVRLADVGPVGWQVLVRDGVLEPVWGDLAAVTGRAVDPVLRAAAVRSLVPPRAVLGRTGAAWVHTGGPVPARFDVLVEPRVRRPSPHPARVPHECPLPRGDVVQLGDVRVTTVLRTALDLARWLEPEVAAALVRRLGRHAGLELDDLVAAAAVAGDRRLPDRVRAVLAGAAQDRAGTPAGREPVMR